MEAKNFQWAKHNSNEGFTKAVIGKAIGTKDRETIQGSSADDSGKAGPERQLGSKKKCVAANSTKKTKRNQPAAPACEPNAATTHPIASTLARDSLLAISHFSSS